jgi:hypothetical protein
MTTPAHIETFISIVVGLALSDVAHSLHRMLRAGRRVRWDLLTPLAALLVTCSVVNTWWTLDLVFSHAVTFAAFLPNLGSLVLLFLLASATLPDQVPAEGLDLKAYYLENRTYFWGLFALWIAALVVNEALLSTAAGRSAGDILASTWRNLLFVPVFGLLMWTRRRWVHGIVLAFCLVVVVGSWAFDSAGSPRPAGEGPAARAAGAPIAK